MSDKQHRNLIFYVIFFFAAVVIAAFTYLSYSIKANSMFSPTPTPEIDYSTITID